MNSLDMYVVFSEAMPADYANASREQLDMALRLTLTKFFDFHQTTLKSRRSVESKRSVLQDHDKLWVAFTRKVQKLMNITLPPDGFRECVRHVDKEVYAWAFIQVASPHVLDAKKRR